MKANECSSLLPSNLTKTQTQSRPSHSRPVITSFAPHPYQSTQTHNGIEPVMASIISQPHTLSLPSLPEHPSQRQTKRDRETNTQSHYPQILPKDPLLLQQTQLAQQRISEKLSFLSKFFIPSYHSLPSSSLIGNLHSLIEKYQNETLRDISSTSPPKKFPKTGEVGGINNSYFDKTINNEKISTEDHSHSIPPYSLSSLKPSPSYQNGTQWIPRHHLKIRDIKFNPSSLPSLLPL